MSSISNVWKILPSFVYISTFHPDKKQVSNKTHFMGRMINSWSRSWVAHLRHQLEIFHHAFNLDVVTLSSNSSLKWYSLLWTGSHIKASWCCRNGYHWFETHLTEQKVVSFKCLNTILSIYKENVSVSELQLIQIIDGNLTIQLIESKYLKMTKAIQMIEI